MNVAGLASGEAPSLSAIADRTPGGATLSLVVADDPDAGVLDAAAARGVPAATLDPSAASFEAELLAAFAERGIDLVCLDGFEPSLERGRPGEWPRTVSVVPALYPAFADAADPVGAALAAGVAVAGATAYELPEDDPTILAQEPVAVGDADRETLAERLDAAGVRASLRAVRSLAGEWSGTADGRFPAHWVATADHEDALRYGENPHQAAAVYAEPGGEPGVVGAPQRNPAAKALSYNNYNDADAALSLVREFDRPAAAVIKHTNPAGCATAGDVATAYDRALSTDPQSAYGGIVALNRECDRETAAAIDDSFKEVVVAPGYTEAAVETLCQRESLRVLSVGEGTIRPDGPTRADPPLVETHLTGGRLVQERDDWAAAREDLEVVTDRVPTDDQVESMLFAWRVVKHVKSNAITFASGTETVGIGAGQMSRVDAVKIARRKAREHAEGKSAEGGAMASDAFFPFPDAVEAAAEAGVEAVIQPGGSVNDEDVVEAADDLGMAMVFTGHRAFRHD